MTATVLVTGGAGYIGSVVADQLLTRGHDVVVLDDLSTGHREAVPAGVTFVHAGIGDRAAVTALFDRRPVHAIVHLAAFALVAESVANPDKYRVNNVANARVLLDAAVAAGVQRFVFSSSCTVYGIPAAVPIAEDAATAPMSPYGETKLEFERLLRDYAVRHRLSSVSLRYFNAAGATERRGEDHDPESHLIPNVLAVALGKRPAVDIFGTDYPTPDGTAVRDYIHVDDLADAHVRAVDLTPDGAIALNPGRATRPRSWRRHSERPPCSAGARGDRVWKRFSRARGGGTARTRAGTGADSVEASVLLQVGRAVPTTPWELVLTSSRETQFVLAVLAVFSVVSWYFIVLKWWQFRRMRQLGDRFLAEVEKVPRLEDAYHAAMRLPPSPYNRLLREGIHFFSELRPGSLKPSAAAGAAAAPQTALTTTQLEALRMVLAKEVAAERDGAARFIPWLATFGSVSPLLGLLGTVLGVMDAFIGIAIGGSGNISAVAPGVAEALVTTVAGLAVAVPAVIAYNIFVNRLGLFAGELEGFAQEIIATLAREGRL